MKSVAYSLVVIAFSLAVYQVVSGEAATTAEEPQASGSLVVTVVDEAGKPVSGVMVGTRRTEWEYGDGVLDQRVPGSLVKWSGNGLRAVPLVTDQDGQVRLKGEYLSTSWQETNAIYAQDPAGGRVALKRITPEDLGAIQTLQLEPACLVQAGFESHELAEQGIPLFETISYLNWNDQQIVLSHHSNEARCAFIVPPGEYLLRLSGYGRGISVPDSGGAPLEEVRKTIVVEPGQHRLDLGTIDLKPTPQGLMVGKPAPPLGEVALWKNAEPFTLEEHRGKVVVLLFWSRNCGGTYMLVPWLGGMYEHLKERGLEVLTIHEADPEISNPAGYDRIIRPMIEEAAANHANEVYPNHTSGNVPIAVAGGKGLGDACEAYHLTHWPTGILIDRNGRVRHVFRHGLDYRVIERALEQEE